MELKVHGMALTFRVPDWHGGPDWFRYDIVVSMMLSCMLTHAHAHWLRVAHSPYALFWLERALHMCLRIVCGCTRAHIYADAARECGGDLGCSTRGVRVLLGKLHH